MNSVLLWSHLHTLLARCWHVGVCLLVGLVGIVISLGGCSTTTPGSTPPSAPTTGHVAQPASPAAPTTVQGETKPVPPLIMATRVVSEPPSIQTERALEATADMEDLFDTATLVLREEFSNNRNYWYTGIFSDVETVQVEGGVLHVIWGGKGSTYETYVQVFTNFIAELDCIVTRGQYDGSCGIIFGRQEGDEGFYDVELFYDYYRVTLYEKDALPVLLIEGDPTGIIVPDDVNRLRVVRIHNEIRLFLNGQLLSTTTDSTFPSGKVGISTKSYTDTEPVEVILDNFAIWKLP